MIGFEINELLLLLNSDDFLELIVWKNFMKSLALKIKKITLKDAEDLENTQANERI